jgi:hypothetical protein
VGDITATLSLGFVEPRYVLGVFGNVAAPYVAARIGYGGLLVRSASDLIRSTDNSFIYGGGLGVIFQVHRAWASTSARSISWRTSRAARAARVISSLVSGCPLASSRTLALGLLLLWGCGGGGDGGGDCDPIAATLVSRIEVTPPAASVADGESVQLTAKAYSCDGSLLAAPTFTWQSSDVTTVSVSTSGMALGVKLGGPVAIKAVAQGKEGAAQVSVVPRAVASVRVEPATANVATGRTSTLVAKAFDAQGNELPGQTATWSSGNEAIVTVSQTGAITGVVPGGR